MEVGCMAAGGEMIERTAVDHTELAKGLDLQNEWASLVPYGAASVIQSIDPVRGTRVIGSPQDPDSMCSHEHFHDRDYAVRGGSVLQEGKQETVGWRREGVAAESEPVEYGIVIVIVARGAARAA